VGGLKKGSLGKSDLVVIGKVEERVVEAEKGGGG
jgi:hypothetical protein